jgi:hypothetical protein
VTLPLFDPETAEKPLGATTSTPPATDTPKALGRVCANCGEPEDGEYGWFENEIHPLGCLSCGLDPLRFIRSITEE